MYRFEIDIITFILHLYKPIYMLPLAISNVDLRKNLTKVVQIYDES